MKERLIDFLTYALIAFLMLSTVAGIVISIYQFVTR